MPDEVTRLVRLLVNLGTLNYTLKGMAHEEAEDLTNPPPLGFFTDAAFVRLADWFSKPKGKPAQIEQAIEALDLPAKWLVPIDTILDSPIGSITWRQLNKDYRNEAISHKSFDAEIFNLIFVKRQVNPETWDSSFEKFMAGIIPPMVDLQSNVQAVFAARFPEFYAEFFRRGMFHIVH